MFGAYWIFEERHDVLRVLRHGNIFLFAVSIRCGGGLATGDVSVRGGGGGVVAGDWHLADVWRWCDARLPVGDSGKRGWVFLFFVWHGWLSCVRSL